MIIFSRRIKALVLNFMFVLIMASSLPAQAQDFGSLAAGFLGVREYETANGKRVFLPPINDDLGCEQINQTIRQIDATGYRELAPEPSNPEDLELFEYENAISKHHYEKCIGKKNRKPASRIFQPESQIFNSFTVN